MTMDYEDRLTPTELARIARDGAARWLLETERRAKMERRRRTEEGGTAYRGTGSGQSVVLRRPAGSR